MAEAELVTCIEGSDSGDAVVFRDGTMTGHSSQARPRGTTVTVRNLFRSVPARLKFLKSTATENSRIAAVVTQYALAFPEVRFTLVNEERNVLRTPGSGNLLDAAVAVFGPETADKLRWFYTEVGGLDEVPGEDGDEPRLRFRSERIELQIHLLENPEMDWAGPPVTLAVDSLEETAELLDETKTPYQLLTGVLWTDRRLAVNDPAGNRVELKQHWPDEAF